MIYISPHGGICNMMRTILAMYDICNRINEPMSIYWEYTAHGKSFWRYAELPLEWYEIFQNKITDVVNTLPSNIVSYVNDKPDYPHSPNIVTSVDLNKLKKLVEGNNVLIDSWGLNYEEMNSASDLNFNILKFNDDYYQTVSKIITDQNIVGIHIRRSDFLTQGCIITPLSFFVNSIENELCNDYTTKFFVATDDKETESYLINRFANKIITYPKNEYSRGSKSFVKTGIVDLLCLSKCKKIYGSYDSSYSRTASHLGKIELILSKE
jgi:hypothetical protein